MILYRPAPWMLSRFLEYVAGNLRAEDGTTITYHADEDSLRRPMLGLAIYWWGTILVIYILYRLHAGLAAGIAAGAISNLLLSFPCWHLWKAIFSNIETSSGHRLRFIAPLRSYQLWQLVLYLSDAVTAPIAKNVASFPLSYLLYGLAWSFYVPWFLSQIAGGTRVLRFHGHPTAAALRISLYACCGALLLPIPWAFLKFWQWAISQVSLENRPSSFPSIAISATIPPNG